MSGDIQVVYLTEGAARAIPLRDARENLLEAGFLECAVAGMEDDVAHGVGWWAGRWNGPSINIVLASKVRAALCEDPAMQRLQAALEPAEG